MFFHFFQREDFSNLRLGRVLTSASHFGQTGVDLFFVLSGFLITGILLHAKGRSNYFRNFYSRRALRIFPLAYTAIVFYYLVRPALHMSNWVSLKQQLWFWLYISNIHDTFFSSYVVDGPAHFWSLAVEEHFYFIWPAIVLLCSRRGLYLATIGCLIVSLASRILLVSLGYDVFSFTLCRLDCLAIGAMLAIFVRGPDGFRGLHRLKPHLVLPVLVPVLFVLWCIMSGKGDIRAQVVKYPVTALLYGTLLAMVLNPMRPALGRVFSVPFLTIFGKYSYGLYVWDGIIYGASLFGWTSSHALMRSLHLKQGVLLMFVSLIVQSTVTCAVAFISWHALESQVLKLKRFFTYDNRPEQAKKAIAKLSEIGG